MIKLFMFLAKDSQIKYLKDTADKNLALYKQISLLTKERDSLKEKVIDFEYRAKKIDEDAKHLVKMKEEQLSVRHKKAMAEINGKIDSKVAKIRDEYRDKVEKNLASQINDVQAMAKNVLDRLPDVNVQLKGQLKSGGK